VVKKGPLALFVFLALLVSLWCQDWISLHREEEKRWAKQTGMSPAMIHQLWRSTSHFADEADDDSHIELLDATTLAERNQILFVTSAGEPRCLTFTVCSKGTGFLKNWTADHSPSGHGFCDDLGIAVRSTVDERRAEIVAPLGRHSPRASHADVAHYEYRWDGRTYQFVREWVGLEFIPR